MTEQNNSFQKPTFDGRIQFYNELNDILHRAGLFSAMKDLEGWYRSLCSALNQCSGLIDPKKEAQLKAQSLVLRRRIYHHANFKTNSLEMHYWRTVDRELNDFEQAFHDAAKELMLPLEKKNGGEPDWERFRRESDLAG